MPDWWHQLTYDLLCIMNSLAAGIALIGVADLRHKVKELIGRS